MKTSFLFPTHVLVTDEVKRPGLDHVLTVEEEDYINQVTTRLRPSHVDGDLKDTIHWVSHEMYVLNHPAMVGLKDWLQQWIAPIMQTLYSSNPSITWTITQSWLTVTEPHHLSFTHIHSNSFMSGVVYLQANRKHDMIEFTRPNTVDRMKIEPYTPHLAKNPSPLVGHAHRIKVHTGDVILFSSHTPHRIMPTPVKDSPARISLAFNVFPSGTLGTYSHANELTVRV